MKAIYDLPTNTLEQLPEMEKPSDSPGYPETGKYAPSNNYWKRKWAEYNAHIASLQRIPCDPSCREIWTYGQEVEEGKDFELIKVCHFARGVDVCRIYRECEKCTVTAVPLSAPVEQDELVWHELHLFLKRKTDYTNFYVGQMIDELRQTYNITKKITP